MGPTKFGESEGSIGHSRQGEDVVGLSLPTGVRQQGTLTRTPQGPGSSHRLRREKRLGSR